MKKILCMTLCLFALCACGKEEAKAGSAVCSYGKQEDDFYMQVDIAYDKSQVVNLFTFVQYIKTPEEEADALIASYKQEMNQFSGVSADAAYENGYIRYHYTVNLNEYNKESDVLGVILPEAINEKGNIKIDLLKKALGKQGYSCE